MPSPSRAATAPLLVSALVLALAAVSCGGDGEQPTDATSPGSAPPRDAAAPDASTDAQSTTPPAATDAADAAGAAGASDSTDASDASPAGLPTAGPSLPPPAGPGAKGIAVPPALAEPSSPAIAIVNGQPLFRSVYDAQLAMLSGQSPEEDIFGDGNGEYAAPEPPTLADRIELLDIMARIELATQEAYQLGFAPRDEQMVEIEARAVEAAGGARELEEALSGTGATMEQFRNQLARNEAMRAWRDAAFLSRARVTEAEARAFYDSHVAEFTHGDEARALQIMFPLPVVPSAQTEQAKERARTRAKEALTQARNGRDFEELQRVFMDPTTMAAVDGGQLGWVGQLGSFPELEEVIFSLKPGETGGPVETPFSIHIVKVLENRAAGTTSFREARPQIVEMISASKIDYLVQERSAALLDAAEVTVVDPLLATAWAEYRRTGALPAAPPDPGAGAAAEDGSSGDTADDGEPGTDGNPEDSDDAADEAPEDSGEVT